MPADLDAAVIVVMHLLPEHKSVLPHLLSRVTGLRVKVVENGDAMAPGCVYVAPPDLHVIVEGGGNLRLDTGPPVHFLRPSADTLLRSLASACAGNCMAVVLTGRGMDGAVGARAVKLAGGHVLVQDPESSEHGGMPRAAIAAGAADKHNLTRRDRSRDRRLRCGDESELSTTAPDPSFEQLLEFVHETRGFDYRSVKIFATTSTTRPCRRRDTPRTR